MPSCSSGVAAARTEASGTPRSSTSHAASLSTPREGEAAPSRALRELLSAEEVHDAIAVVGLLNLANRAALATAIGTADDLS